MGEEGGGDAIGDTYINTRREVERGALRDTWRETKTGRKTLTE